MWIVTNLSNFLRQTHTYKHIFNLWDGMIETLKGFLLYLNWYFNGGVWIPFDIEKDEIYIWKILDGPFFEMHNDGYEYAWYDVMCQINRDAFETTLNIRDPDDVDKIEAYFQKPTLNPYKLDSSTYGGQAVLTEEDEWQEF